MKQILLIRHGQGDHNKLFAEGRVEEALALMDPGINEVGVRQAEVLADKLKEVLPGFGLELIISSPMKRALMTTDVAFGTPTPSPVIVSPLPSEMGDGGCDYGSPKSVIAQQFPHHDFTLVEPENWWNTDETEEQLYARIADFKSFLNSRPENKIAVVSHGHFLTKLVGSVDYCKFWNCECRLVTLDNEGKVEDPGTLLIRESLTSGYQDPKDWGKPDKDKCVGQ